MESDQLFRIVLVAGAILFLPVMIFHRVRAHSTDEWLDRREEGLFILLTLRPIGVAGMLGLIVFMIHPPAMAWSAMPLPAWARWTGMVLALAAGGLLVWTLGHLGRNLTDTVVTRRDHTLITTGPYRWVRHPFYDAVALAVTGNALAAANWFILVCGALVFALLMLRLPREEQRLIDRFGDEYRSYISRTGRLLPRVRG